jgi:NADH:ubiquinone oxidoreductase subunit 2 (subunit N)
VATGIGIVTFVAANLLALPQTNDRRLLGYSSIAQTGLVLAVLGQRDILGDDLFHRRRHPARPCGRQGRPVLALQPGSGADLSAWAALRGRPLLIFAFVSFIALLTGLPPFPGFYAKWELVHALAGAGPILAAGLILFGALIEAGYLFRWFGYAIKRDPAGRRSTPRGVN